MRKSLPGIFLHRSSEMPTGTTKPSQAKKPMKAPSEKLQVPIAEMAKLRIHMEMIETTIWITYDPQTRLMRVSARSFSDMPMRVIHSLPNSNGEYHRAPIPNETRTETKMDQMLMGFMKIGG